ncbi:MAG: response regulator [Deltaproteobacteria bacterium]|nr:response regulator [Deltaproteobacteria bacterium]
MKTPESCSPGPELTTACAQELRAEIARLRQENAELKTQQQQNFLYIRRKVDQLLQVIGTVPLRPEELDDQTLIELDPIGIVSEAFSQVIEHLKDTNEDLRVIHEELQAVFDSAPIGIVVLDVNCCILNSNNYAVIHILRGKSDLSGCACYQAICDREAPADFCLMQKVVAEGVTCRKLEWLIGGCYYDAIATPVRNDDGGISAVVVVFVDVTAQRRLDEEMARSQKLESLGLLAGGLAHDFNNFLAAILNNVTLARVHSEPQDKIYALLQKTETAASRAQHLTQQLLTFAKGGLPVLQDVTFAKLVQDSVLFALSGSNVQCHFTLPADLFTVRADPGQIDQVIRNLIINCDQAMPHGGKIEVSCRNLYVAENEHSGLAPGNYVLLAIRDHGVGIAPENLNKIFDPYFTTKETGNGLGLAISHAIIGKHLGHISVASQLGVGTTFEVLLPALESALPEVVDEELKSSMSGGRVLVMDDDVIVCETTAELLSFVGYNVTTAADGREAIKLYQEARHRNQPIDIVILDLTVPGGMGGEETIRELRKLDADVVAVATSGYCNNPVMANYSDYGFKGVLPKPCKLEMMQQVIAELLSAR